MHSNQDDDFFTSLEVQIIATTIIWIRNDWHISLSRRVNEKQRMSSDYMNVLFLLKEIHQEKSPL